MLDKKELTQVRDYVIEILPELLRREPGIVRTIDHIIAEQFPRRDEFARLLDEVKAERLAAQERSEQVDARFEEQREETNRGFAALRAEMNQRFGQVDARFEQMDARFEQVDARFEQVDQQLKEQRNETSQLREEMNQRFEEHHRILLDLKRGVLKLQQGQESLIKQMEAQEKWIRLKIGEIGNEKGESAEDFFAEGLRYGLKNPHISADKIRLRQPLVDTEGVVFKQPFASEVDLIIDNDQLIVFEIKSGRVKAGDVSFFLLKVGVVAAQNPDKQVRGALIAPFAGDDVRQRCLELGVELVD